MRMLVVCLTIFLLLSACQKSTETIIKDYTRNFTILDTNWRLLVDKYHPDYLPPMKSMHMTNCTIIFDSTYSGQHLSFFIKNHQYQGNEIGGLYTGPIITNDTVILPDPSLPFDIKNYIDSNFYSLSGRISIKNHKFKIIDFKMIKFSGKLKIQYDDPD